MKNHAADCDLLSTAPAQVASNLRYPELDFYRGESGLFSLVENVPIVNLTAVKYLTVI